MFRGKDLDKDEAFIKRCEVPEFKKQLVDDAYEQQGDITKNTQAKKGLIIFLLGIASVVFVAMFNKSLGLLPDGVKMATAIQFMMLGIGSIILLVSNVDPKKIVVSNVFTAGMTAVIIIFGIAWMSDTIIEHHKTFLVASLSDIVKSHPWTFAIAMFVSSIFLKSQAAVLTIMFPLGLTLGIPLEVLIGVIPACYAYFFFPFYPSDLAAIQFDRSGTTSIGKYVLNHSFIIPGFIGVVTATLVGYLISVIL